MITNYMCYFSIVSKTAEVGVDGYHLALPTPHDSRLITRETMIPTVVLAQHGFWVDANYEYTASEDNVYWIPPSAVLMVQKTSTLNN